MSISVLQCVNSVCSDNRGRRTMHIRLGDGVIPGFWVLLRYITKVGMGAFSVDTVMFSSTMYYNGSHIAYVSLAMV